MADAAAKFYEAAGLFRSAELASDEASRDGFDDDGTAAGRARSASPGAAGRRGAARHISVSATARHHITGDAGVATT